MSKARDVVNSVLDSHKNSGLEVKVFENKEVLETEVFVSINANDSTKKIAKEICESLAKDLKVKTKYDMFSRDFYKEFEEDVNIIVFLEKEEVAKEVEEVKEKLNKNTSFKNNRNKK